MNYTISGINLVWLLFFSLTIRAQIFPDRHTTNAFDGWISCTKSTNPNALRGASHWIRYEFNTVVNLFDMTIWNLNHPDYIKDGFNTVIIDVSTDGSSWTLIDTFTFPKAPGSGFYEGFRGPDLGGVTARYLLITALSNHGGGCYGLSEMRVYTTEQDHQDLKFDFTACENDGIQVNLTGGVAMGGHYSGIGVTDNGNETFNFDVDKVGPGQHEIQYHYGSNTLTGQITVLPCSDPVCQECKQCSPVDILTVDGSIPTDIYNGYQVLSGGEVENNADVQFMINNSAQLNAGFEVRNSGTFLVDFRTCYNNVLQNSGFESGSSPWSLSLSSGATATFTIDNNEPYDGVGSARVQVSNTNGTDWHIQLNQNNQSMTAGKRYRISFAARTNGGGSQMSVILQLTANPWTVYADHDFVVTENWETYAFEFVGSTTLNNNVAVRALLGSTANKTFWIDNFRYIPLDQ